MKSEKKSKSISWLQISDLHIVDGTQWNIMYSKYMELGEELHPNFIVMTGDYRNIQYKENMDYSRSLEFLNSFTEALGVSKEDVFFVPGNHDVNEYESRQEIINEIIGDMEKDEDTYRKNKRGNTLKDAFAEYNNFIRRFYGGLVTDIRVRNPAGVASVIWKKRLNIILVNTALISDGKRNHEEILDIYELSKIRVDKKLPTIVLGHHDILDICRSQRENIVNIFDLLNVKAYLCGDTHRTQKRFFEKRKVPNTTIPCIVCGKSAVDSQDNYSDVGFIWYEWKNNKVFVEPYEWSFQNDFVKSNIFFYNLKKDYYFLMENNIETADSSFGYISENGDDVLIRPGNGNRGLILFSKKSLKAHDFKPKKEWSDKICRKITSFAADGNGGFLAIEDGKIQLAYVRQDIFYKDSYLRTEQERLEKGLGNPIAEIWIKDGVCFFCRENGSIVCSHNPDETCLEVPPPKMLYVVIEDIKLSIIQDEGGYKIECNARS